MTKIPPVFSGYFLRKFTIILCQKLSPVNLKKHINGPIAIIVVESRRMYYTNRPIANFSDINMRGKRVLSQSLAHVSYLPHFIINHKAKK